MGASYFQETIKGANLATAFDEAVRQARWEHGHGGYTGTLAEKSEVRELNLENEVYSARNDLELRLVALKGRRGPEQAAERARTKAALRTLKTKSSAKRAARAAAVADHYTDRGMDKWGPAFAIRVKRGAKVSEWLVFGAASC
jgi:hypothetical protein